MILSFWFKGQGPEVSVRNVTTCTTGTCPCNTANVSGVPWRVSGQTEGCLFTVLGTWEVTGGGQRSEVRDRHTQPLTSRAQGRVESRGG